MQIAVIDFGTGNLRSVETALCAVAPDTNIIVTHDPKVINSADKIVMPGQGAIGTWFMALRERKLESAVRQSLKEKPTLAICVGMQALFEHCEEGGGHDGLGVFQGSVSHFSNFHDDETARLKIPQMGWNQVSQIQEHALWYGIDEQSYFYFVHSFCANTQDDVSALYGSADYGHEFIAAIGRDKLFAVQFHPEKSHNDGLTLLRNFTQWNG